MRGVVALGGGSWWVSPLVDSSGAGLVSMMRNISGSRSMSWVRILDAVRDLSAHCSLMCFSAFLVLKLSGRTQVSWWWIFCPLWIFHVVVARGRFSIPAPSAPRDRHWAPCHAVIAVPLLVAFELLLCSFLDSNQGFGTPIISLKIVFIPLLILEAAILVDNFRMCRALMPADEESLTDEIIWETLPHFWIAVSMVFFMAATVFTMLKLTGDFSGLGWWDLFINFGIAECFTFLVCTKWSNPVIHQSQHRTAMAKTLERNESTCSSSSALSLGGEVEDMDEGMCGKEDIGGHIIKVPIIIFQVLLCMRLEGTPPRAKHIPMGIIFMPLLLIQGMAILFSFLQLVERLYIIMHAGHRARTPFAMFADAHDCCGFLRHGSRLLGWWSIDEGSKEEHIRLLTADPSTYRTFPGPTPDVVKKMGRKDLAEQIFRLQAALGEQTEIANYQQQEFDRLQSEKVLCRVCFEREISVVLIPCKHRVLCSTCSEKCKLCPVCRSGIGERMMVFDV